MIKFNINSVDSSELIKSLMTPDVWNSITFIEEKYKSEDYRLKFIQSCKFVQLKAPRKLPMIEVSYWDTSGILGNHLLSWWGSYDFSTGEIEIKSKRFSLNY